MKKLILSFCVFSFALFFVLISCDIKKPEGATASVAEVAKPEVTPVKDTPPPPAGRSYISVSQLAFKAYMLNPGANINEAKALFLNAQSDSYTMAMNSAPQNQSSDGVMMSLRSTDLCPCPKAYSTTLCPCPGDSTMVRMIAPASVGAMLIFDEMKLKSSPVKEKMDGNWVAFEWPAKLTDGPHTLTITGKFAGKDSKKSYKLQLPMEVKDAKLFMKWPN
ncbi:MAG TPA: hypothetical protein VGD65_05635 [Chryseosolibacter sp.]